MADYPSLYFEHVAFADPSKGVNLVNAPDTIRWNPKKNPHSSKSAR